MKEKKKTNVKRILLSVVMALTLLAGTIPYNMVQAATMTQNRSKATIAVGETIKFNVGTKGKKGVWSVKNSQIASVNKQTGLVKGRSEGTTEIKAVINKRTYKFNLTVDNPQLETEEIELQVGESYELVVLGSDRTFDYESNDEDLAEVNDSGVIHAVDLGDTEIIISNGQTELVCLVHIIDE